jgi:hypothetical protein
VSSQAPHQAVCLDLGPHASYRVAHHDETLPDVIVSASNTRERRVRTTVTLVWRGEREPQPVEVRRRVPLGGFVVVETKERYQKRMDAAPAGKAQPTHEIYTFTPTFAPPTGAAKGGQTAVVVYTLLTRSLAEARASAV